MKPNFATSALYALDNLDVMRGMDSETVQLIYLDPPFNSKRMYQGMPGSLAAAQGFRDTWSWNDAKQEWLDRVWDDAPGLYQAVLTAKEHSPGMGGYACFMAVRLLEMRRILTHEGSLYLHCDPSANAYLRILLDSVFGSKNFRNEIVWRRAHSKNAVDADFGRNHDTVLRYAKSELAVFNKDAVRRPYESEGKAPAGFRQDREGRYYALSPAHAPGRRNGDCGQSAVFRGLTYTPPPDRHWTVAGGRRPGETTGAAWERLDAAGRMYLAPNGKYPAYIRYLDEMPGIALDDVWTDVPIPGVKENTGWATQKPLSLMERIIKASSRPGDIVFDPFCGSGTTLVAAENTGRKWVGADDDANAANVISDRISALSGRLGGLHIPVSVMRHPPQRTESPASDRDSGVSNAVIRAKIPCLRDPN